MGRFGTLGTFKKRQELPEKVSPNFLPPIYMMNRWEILHRLLLPFFECAQSTQNFTLPFRGNIWDSHKMGKIPREIFKWNTASLFVYYFIINDSSPMILFALRYVIEDPEDLWFCIYRPITDIYMIFKIVFCQHWATNLFFVDYFESE